MLTPQKPHKYLNGGPGCRFIIAKYLQKPPKFKYTIVKSSLASFCVFKLF